MDKLRSGTGDNNEKVSFTSTKSSSDTKEVFEVTQISFGALNVILESTKPTDKNDLRKNFDERFKMSSDEKIPNVLSQEIGDKVTYEITRESNNGPKTLNDFSSVKNIKKIYKVLEDSIGSRNVPSKESLQKWPEKTNILCHWCCHSFDSEPVPCPISHDKIKDRFQVRGIFCGWPCVYAYSSYHFKSLSHVYMFLMKLYDEVPDIVPAPDKVVLKSFGGPMTIEKVSKLWTPNQRS